MKINIRRLFIAAAIITLASLALSGSPKRPGTTPAHVDRLSSARVASHVAWFGVANFIQEEGFTDLSVTKAAGSDTAAAGDNVTFTIQVTNGGPDMAINATLDDNLPPGMYFVSLSSPAGWSCLTPSVGSGGSVSCSNPALDVNSGETFTLVVQIDPMAPSGSFFTNIATVNSATPDDTDENDNASATVFVPGVSADIGVLKSASAELTLDDTDVTYTIVVNNAGPNAAANAAVNDALPGDMTFVSLSFPAGWSCTTPSQFTNGTVNCTNPSLASGASATFTLVAHVPAGSPDGTIYQNTATVSTTTQDPNSENNLSSATTTTATCFDSSVVTTNADSGPGSLRQAILDACPGGAISFDPGVVSPIALTSGALLIDKNLTIAGPGANLLTVKRDGGAANFRVFDITATGVVTISGLTISDGKAIGLSSAANQGGGILNESSGTVNVTDSTLTGNYAEEAGGAIFNRGSGTVRVTNSTLSANDTNGGGAGIYNQSNGAVSVTNSTISGNSSDGFGAGIFNESNGTVVVTNATITGNTAAQGAGIRNQTGTVQIKNSIIALNIAPIDPDLQGTITSLGYNIVGSIGSATITPQTGDQFGITAAQLRLGALANNGGPTQTHALLSGSVALDAGNNAFVTDPPFTGPVFYDQRGTPFDRFRDAGSDADITQTVDIGAFEADPSIEDISDKVTAENTPLVFSFDVGDSSTPFSSITTSSSNTTLVPNGNIGLSGSGSTRTITITPVANLSGTSTITITLAKTVGGVPQTSTDTFLLTVQAVNDAPVNTVPGSQSVNENGTLTFNAANSNSISIADIDAGSNPVQVTLTATNGTVTLSGTSGLTFTPANASNDGLNDATLTFTGTVTNINNALNGMSFTATTGFDGPASLQIATNDLGNTGSGGAKSDTDTVNITVNDGGTLAFSPATYTVAESGISVTITVNRSGGTNGEARVNYATSNGSATAGQDYTATTGQLIFPGGVTTQTFSVPIINDTLDEADETINLTLSSPAGSGALGTPAAAVVTITDDDGGPSLSINDVTLNEGNSGTTNFTFTVTLSSASGQVVTVNYATADLTALAPNDYTAKSGTLTFNPGVTTQTISVLVNGETVAEPDETFFVNLSGATNASLEDSQGRGVIINDDTPFIHFTSSTQNVNEGAGHAAVTVTRTGDLAQTASVNYASTDLSGLNECAQITGHASQRCDYTTVVGTLRFASGEASKDIIIPIIDDTHIEGGGNEIFTLTLSNAVGGHLDSPNAVTISIVDNDAVPAANPISNDAFFIRQLYIDLLGRLPEPGAVNNWLAILNHCATPTDPVNGCDRIAVAAAFLRSEEFQGRGYFVYRHYSAVLGRIPLYTEFVPDMAKVNGFLSGNDLEANKVAYTAELMDRAEFHALYDSTLNNPTAFVDKLLQVANLPNHPGRTNWIAGLTNGTLTRAQVVREFIDSPQVYAKSVSEAFIIMNYFGFLRRTADASYQAWFNLFNQTGDYRLVIGGFINSAEYRLRFGPG